MADNPKHTTNFLLGQIAADVATIKDRQEKIDRKIDEGNEAVEKKIAAIQLEIDEIKELNTYARGKAAGLSAAISATIAALGMVLSKIF